MIYNDIYTVYIYIYIVYIHYNSLDRIMDKGHMLPLSKGASQGGPFIVPDSGETLAEEVLARLGYDDDTPEFTEFALAFYAQSANKSDSAGHTHCCYERATGGCYMDSSLSRSVLHHIIVWPSVLKIYYNKQRRRRRRRQRKRRSRRRSRRRRKRSEEEDLLLNSTVWTHACHV